MRDELQALLQARHPGRDNTTFRYAVRRAVDIILVHRNSGSVMAVPCPTPHELVTLEHVARMLEVHPAFKDGEP